MNRFTTLLLLSLCTMLTSTLAGRGYRPYSSLPPVKVTVDPNIRKGANGNILVAEPGVQIGDVFIADPIDIGLAVIKEDPSTGQGSIKTGQLTRPDILVVDPTIPTENL